MLGVSGYTVAVGVPRRLSIRAVLAAAAIFGAALLYAGITKGLAPLAAGAVVGFLPLAAGWFIGDSVAARRRYVAGLAEQAERERAAEAERARQEVREERVRIARELHDVVAHTLTVITVQAGVGRRLMAKRPEEAGTALESIEMIGRTAQDELRVVLGLLRDEDAGAAALAPAPRLADLKELADTVRASGTPVELRTSGTDRQLSPALELTLYRVVQEALTNVVRHAPQARATVDLTVSAAQVRLEVTDDGGSAGRDGGRLRNGPAFRARATGSSGCGSGSAPSAAGSWPNRSPAASACSPRSRSRTRGERRTRSGRSSEPGGTVTTGVLVVDDQALLRTAFSSLIDAEDDLEVVGEAADGRQAVELAASLAPDVVVMDVRMPVMDGIEATRQITSGPGPGGARVLILTTFDLDEYVFEALRAGASGFALKSRPLDELLNAIRIVAAGEALLAPSVTRRLIAHFAGQAENARQNAARPGGAHRARARGAVAGRRGAVERRARPDAACEPPDGQDAREPDPDQARCPGPDPAGHPGLPVGARHPGLSGPVDLRASFAGMTRSCFSGTMTARRRSPTIACHEHLLGSGLTLHGRRAGRAPRPRPGARRPPAGGPADRRRGLRRHAHRPPAGANAR